MAAQDFPPQLKSLITEKGYSPEQVFNCDETGLFWKKMPSRTFLNQEEKRASGFKAAKDRYTLLLCANAAGTFRCKPMLVYKFETPRALKGKRKEHLPVFWKSNKSAWVTKKNFEEWFIQSFIPEVKEFLRNKNLSFKVLLLLDNAPSHSETTNTMHPDVEVMFFPPNTTSLIQPMDQTVISTFKAYYLRRVIREMLKAVNRFGVNRDEESCRAVRSFWKSFTISDSIRFVSESWEEVKPSTLNHSWRKAWPEVVQDASTPNTIQGLIQGVAEAARSVGGQGFDDVQEAEITQLLLSDTEDLSPENIEEVLDKPQIEEESPEHEPPGLTAEAISKMLNLIHEAAEIALTHDPVMTRSLQFQRSCEQITSGYEEVYRDLIRRMKQARVTSYFTAIPKP